MTRRMILLFIAAAALILIPTYYIISPASLEDRFASEPDFEVALLQDNYVEGVMMPKMRNETAKAELGRAGWRLLHTMGQRYPDHPSAAERKTFSDFLFLFAKMYPCGECASHFQQMLKDYPPQTSSKNTASLYLCMLHNKVNARLKKEEFDCSKLEGLYDCGCGDESSSASSPSQKTKKAEVIRAATEEPPDLVDANTGEHLVHG